MIGISLFFILVLATFYRIYIAFDTHPGLVIENPYKKGENYATTLANKEKLQKLGWRTVLNFPTKLKTNVSQKYTAYFLINDKPSSSEQAQLFFYRPSSIKADFQIKMIQNKEHYFADVIVPLKGVWRVSVKIIKNKQTIHKGKENGKKVFYH
jgi:nitrogen fixation protein FixH